MRCPYCRSENTKVIDSRMVRNGEEIRRRRECEESQCGGRFTTFERVEHSLPMVVKRNDNREPYDRNKVKRGIMTAMWKRGTDEDQVEMFLNGLERKLAESFRKEIRTTEIGQEVLLFLKTLDPVAHVRFASVYGDFRTVHEFVELISNIDGTTQ